MWGTLLSLGSSMLGNSGSSLWGAAPGSQAEWDMFDSADFDSISNQGIRGMLGTHGMPSFGGQQAFGPGQAMQMGMSQSKAPQMQDPMQQLMALANRVGPGGQEPFQPVMQQGSLMPQLLAADQLRYQPQGLGFF